MILVFCKFAKRFPSVDHTSLVIIVKDSRDKQLLRIKLIDHKFEKIPLMLDENKKSERFGGVK